MSLLVQKYGGTSIGTGERLSDVAGIIQTSLKEHRVIVVVSALSNSTKTEGTTSRLLEAGKQAVNGGSFSRILDQVKKTHLEALHSSIDDPAIMDEVGEFIHQELQSLKSFLEAIDVIREISARSQDMIIGTGERLSARLLSGVLKSRGIDSVYTDLSECVKKKLSNSNTRFFSDCEQAFRKKLPQNPLFQHNHLILCF